MMGARIVIRDEPRRGAFFAFDATLTENHSLTDVVTRFPVEQGVSIADHVRKEPDSITLTGVVSSLSIRPDDSSGIPPTAQRIADALAIIESMRGRLLNVLSSTRSYRNMVIGPIVATRSGSNEVLDVSVTLTQVRTVESQTISLPEPREPRGNATKKAGPRSGVETTQPSIVSNDTILGGMINQLGKLTGTDTDVAALVRR